MTAAVAPPAEMDDWRFCATMLPRVSRTFALGIRLLPPALSRAVTVSYLLCRIADTIEDDTILPVGERARLLTVLATAVSGAPHGLADVRSAGRRAHEADLMAGADRVLAEFHRLPARDQVVIRTRVAEMSRGMARYLAVPDGSLTPLCNDMADLRQYCYFVAGTVGHLLTDLFQLHRPAITDGQHAALTALATDFGLGLQLTNVIRDIVDDRLEGRNLVPRELWADAGVRPDELFVPGSAQASWRLIEPLFDEATRCLRHALAYCTTLPRTEIRLRVFCCTALFFACRTLTLIRQAPARLVAGERIKMPRREVYRLTAVAIACAPSNGALRFTFGRLLPESGPSRRIPG